MREWATLASRAAPSTKQLKGGVRELRRRGAAWLQGSNAPLVEPAKSTMMGIGLWESKSDTDAWATTGPWRMGSELRDKFDGLLTEESTREEFEVAYLHVPASSNGSSLVRPGLHTSFLLCASNFRGFVFHALCE